MRKRIPRISLASFLLLSLLLPAPASAEEAPPALSAEAAVLSELGTGRVLYEKNGDRPMKAASTVKILTALTALDALDPKETVTVAPEWTGAEGSSMYLRPGEELTVEELLCGLLLVSGNDAARALACAAAGTEEAFVARMNEKARALGMADSRFSDASGLASEGHWVTARDMAVLAGAAMENGLIRDVVSRKKCTAAGRTLRNHNKLLWLYEGALGVKTGYTRAAGRTLVSCARREGLTLVCVTLNAPEDWKDHAALLDWGFAHYASPEPGGRTWTVEVVSGLSETVEAVPGEGELPLLPREGWHWEVQLPGFVYAPVSAGETAGRLLCRSEDGEILAEVPLLFARDVPLDPEVPLDFWEKLRWTWFFACRHAPGAAQTAFY